MSRKYILAIDQGTTSTRAVIYTQDLEVVGIKAVEFEQHFPKPGWVEHDLEQIWASVRQAVQGALGAVTDALFEPKHLAAIGITNQRETFGLWFRETGEPAMPAIVWQCRRSADICSKLKKAKTGKDLARITGLVMDPYFSGTKLKWAFENDRNLKTRAQAGDLLFGTIDSFLIHRLTQKESHVTDTSNASRTMLMDLKSHEWSAAALKILGVPKQCLPKILPSDSLFGVTKGLGFLPDGIPICGVLGDQQAALFGQACFEPGQSKITYGTGAFFLVNTGSKLCRTSDGLTTVAWTLAGKTTYALEGSVFMAGALVSWLRDALGVVTRSADLEALARQVPSSEGVFVIPAFAGLGAPDWMPAARGLIGGLSRSSSRAHLARAAIEGIAHSVADSFSQLVKSSGTRLKSLRVDGGASRNGLLLQAQADFLQTAVERPRDIESTARGAALLAAYAAGLGTLAHLSSRNLSELRVAPQMSKKDATAQRALWRRRVKALKEGCF